MSGVSYRTELARFCLWHTNMRAKLASGRSRLLTGFALLLVILLVLAWIGLTHQFYFTSPTKSASASTLAQVEPPRIGSSLVYDPLQHVVLLFGGTLLVSGGAQSNETWTWNGQSWQQLHPASSPPALQGNMVYDAASQQIILFLNQVPSEGNVANEMWSWNGRTWQQLRPTLMPEVIGASMAYDAARGQVLLFGGAAANGHAGTLSNATWTWNGSNWQQQHPSASPSARTGASLTYDDARQQSVLFGGITADGLSSETWTWNGLTWQQLLNIQPPSSRQHALLIYDSATHQLLLFGGLNPAGTQPVAGDTWTLRDNGWSKVSATGAPAELYSSATYDDATRTVVVYTVKGSLDKLTQANSFAPTSQTWTWNGTSWKLL